jgi:hypothetical protein
LSTSLGSHLYLISCTGPAASLRRPTRAHRVPTLGFVCAAPVAASGRTGQEGKGTCVANLPKAEGKKGPRTLHRSAWWESRRRRTLNDVEDTGDADTSLCGIFDSVLCYPFPQWAMTGQSQPDATLAFSPFAASKKSLNANPCMVSSRLSFLPGIC